MLLVMIGMVVDTISMATINDGWLHVMLRNAPGVTAQ